MINLETLQDSNLYTSFSGTAVTTQTVELPAGAYRGFVIYFDYTITQAAAGLAAGQVADMIDSMELKVNGNSQWRLNSGQLPTFSILSAIRQKQQTIVDGATDMGTIPTTSALYYDAVPTTAQSQQAQYVVFAPYSGQKAELEITLNPLVNGAATALTMGVKIGLIHGSGFGNMVADIREETSETRNDFEPAFSVDMMYIRTTIADDLTKIEGQGLAITNTQLFQQTFNAALGVVQTEGGGKNYLIQSSIPVGGQLSITGATAENRTVYLFSGVRVATANSATGAVSVSTNQLTAQGSNAPAIRKAGRPQGRPRLSIGRKGGSSIFGRMFR
jgi:hypothetical protein